MRGWLCKQSRLMRSCDSKLIASLLVDLRQIKILIQNETNLINSIKRKLSPKTVLRGEKNWASSLPHTTYIIIEKIEINIRCKLIGQNLQLTFDALRFSKHFVAVPLGGRLGKPLAYISAHPCLARLLSLFYFSPASLSRQEAELIWWRRKNFLRMFHETLLECEWIMEYFPANFFSLRSQLTSEQIDYEEDELLSWGEKRKKKHWKIKHRCWCIHILSLCDWGKVKVSKKLCKIIAMEIAVMEQGQNC